MKNPVTPTNRKAATTYYRMAIAGGKNINFQPTCGHRPGFGTDGGVHNFPALHRRLGRGQISTIAVRWSASLFAICYRHLQVLQPGLQSAQSLLLLDNAFLDPTKLPPGTPMLQDVVNLTYFRTSNSTSRKELRRLLTQGRRFFFDATAPMISHYPASILSATSWGSTWTPSSGWASESLRLDFAARRNCRARSAGQVGHLPLRGSFLGGLADGGAFLQRERDDAEHVVPGCGLASPDFELACAWWTNISIPGITSAPRSLASFMSRVSAGS